MSETPLLGRIADLAREFLDTLPHRPVGARADLRSLRTALGGVLPAADVSARGAGPGPCRQWRSAAPRTEPATSPMASPRRATARVTSTNLGDTSDVTVIRGLNQLRRRSIVRRGKGGPR